MLKRVFAVLSGMVFVAASSIFFGCACEGDGCGKSRSRTSYDIDCELTGDVLSGSETVDFYNDSDNSFSELKFNIYGNAFRKGAKYSPISAQYLSQAYPNGINYGYMQITSVKDKDGDLEYEIGGVDENVLIVKLREEVFPEERVSTTIDFKLKLANVVARTGINDDTVNLGQFYPQLCGIQDGAFYECVYYSTGDPFFSDCADYTVTLTVDAYISVASGGMLVSKKEQGPRNVFTFSINDARSFVFVLSEKFESVTADVDGVTVNYYYYDDARPEKSLKCAVESLKYFGEAFGDYPYRTYSVVQTGFVQGGMEYSGLAMISDLLEEKAYNEVIVHETAHQWWQVVVGNNEIEYGFLDEGLAEYSVVLFFENHDEYGFTRSTLIKSSELTFKTFCSVYDKLYGNVDTSMLRSLDEYSGEYEYVNVCYVKPCLMYDGFRASVGDEKFFKALKRYYADYSFKNAEPYDVVGCFEKAGVDAGGYFTAFYEGKEIL